MVPSLLVHDLNVHGADSSPYEADAPLGIDADAVLTLSIVFQRFQVIARWRLQEGQCLCGVKLGKLALGELGQSPEPARTPALVKSLCLLALERLDHARSVLRAA